MEKNALKKFNKEKKSLKNTSNKIKNLITKNSLKKIFYEKNS